LKGFKFKLQSVLDTREKKFEDAQLEFAKVKNRLHNEQKTLNSINNDLEQTENGLEFIIKSGNIDYTFVFCHYNYISKLKGDVIYQQEIIKQVEKQLEEKNRLMLEALKEKTMMEKLKEKALEEFKKTMEKQDFINIDEIAVNRYKRTG